MHLISESSTFGLLVPAPMLEGKPRADGFWVEAHSFRSAQTAGWGTICPVNLVFSDRFSWSRIILWFVSVCLSFVIGIGSCTRVMWACLCAQNSRTMAGQICVNERLRVLNLCKAQNRRKLDAKIKKKEDGEAACMHIYALHSILCLWRHKTDGCGDLILTKYSNLEQDASINLQIFILWAGHHRTSAIKASTWRWWRPMGEEW